MSVPSTHPYVLDLVRAAVAAGTSVSLVGLPGSGRSTLLSRVRAAADDDDWDVVAVPGRSAGGDRPLESLVLAGLAAGPTGALGTMAAAVDGLARAADGRRRLFLLDDADALDDASAAVVGTVVARQGAGVVATLRPPFPGARPIDRVLAGRDATVLQVPVLPFQEVHRMVSELLGGHVDSDVTSRVFALSGGLPGTARSIVLEARRARHLVETGGRWAARRDLWTPALAVAVGRLVEGLGTEEQDALRVLATLGPAGVATVRRLLPWSVVVTLDDRGLVRFVEEADRTLVVLFPPLLAEHLVHLGHDARGERAAETISAALDRGDDEVKPLRRPVLGPPMRWSSSPESAAILGRVLREHAAMRLLVDRDAWEREPTSRNTVTYLDALLIDGAPPELIDEVLAETRRRYGSEPHRYRAYVTAWEVNYRALVLRDLPAALALVTDVQDSSDPRVAGLFHAVTQHLRLVLGTAGSEDLGELPAVRGEDAHAGQEDRDPEAATTADDELLVRAQGGILIRTEDVVRTVRGEAFLARGLVVAARRELEAVVLPAAARRQDATSLVPHAMLLAGEIEAATDRAMRLLDEARGTLEPRDIEPYGYTVGLGLFLQGRFTSLREHLTSIFAVSSPSPLRPTTRAGLLTLASALSLFERNVPSARSLLAQLESMRLEALFGPMARPGPYRVALALASGADAREAGGAAWDQVMALAAHGHVLAATFDAAVLADIWLDEDGARRVSELAVQAQGTLLPALGRYLGASADRSADGLLLSVDELRDRHLEVYATRAHVTAIGLLRGGGHSARVAEESSRLRARVARRGEELDLLLSALAPGEELTPRELEVARLVAAGLSNREVASRLVVSDRTVDNHLYRIFRKLGISSRDEIAGLV